MNANNAPVSGFDYDAFGQPTEFVVNEEMHYLYTGQEYDSETGLWNFRARMYDSDLMRFYSVDPMEQGNSPYLFCGNNPVMFVDRDGNIFFWAPVIVGAMIGAFIGAIEADYNGVDPFQGALKGAIVGAVGGALSNIAPTGLLANTLVSALEGGVTGGLNAALYEENIWEGFTQGAAYGGAFGALDYSIESTGNYLNSKKGYWRTDYEEFERLYKESLIRNEQGVLCGVDCEKAQEALNFYTKTFGTRPMFYDGTSNTITLEDLKRKSRIMNDGTIYVSTSDWIACSDFGPNAFWHETAHYYKDMDPEVYAFNKSQPEPYNDGVNGIRAQFENSGLHHYKVKFHAKIRYISSDGILCDLKRDLTWGYYYKEVMPWYERFLYQLPRRTSYRYLIK